jgi:hypothetical protein
MSQNTSSLDGPTTEPPSSSTTINKTSSTITELQHIITNLDELRASTYQMFQQAASNNNTDHELVAQSIRRVRQSVRNVAYGLNGLQSHHQQQQQSDITTTNSQQRIMSLDEEWRLQSAQRGKIEMDEITKAIENGYPSQQFHTNFMRTVENIEWKNAQTYQPSSPSDVMFSLSKTTSDGTSNSGGGILPNSIKVLKSFNIGTTNNNSTNGMLVTWSLSKDTITNALLLDCTWKGAFRAIIDMTHLGRIKHISIKSPTSEKNKSSSQSQYSIYRTLQCSVEYKLTTLESYRKRSKYVGYDSVLSDILIFLHQHSDVFKLNHHLPHHHNMNNSIAHDNKQPQAKFLRFGNGMNDGIFHIMPERVMDRQLS